MENISWNEYFMESAILAAKRSKDPCTKVGAVLVNKDNRIIGSGYNGFPNGIPDHCLPWTKGSKNFEENKYAYVVHAEANCILNSITADMSDCTMYVTLFPCSSCLKLIIQKGIKKFIFKKYPNTNTLEKTGDYLATKKMLSLTGITYHKYDPEL